MASLIDCQFCGVAFELARVRRPNEPKEAAWTPDGEGYLSGDYDDCLGHLCEWLERSEEDARKYQYPGIGSGPREHLAGPDCTLRWGYSGARILAAEMKGFCYVQCLMQKTQNWQPNEDDNDYERDSDYFLSGISHCPDPQELHFEYIPSSKQRHGTDPFFISNSMIDSYEDIQLSDKDEGDYRDAIPFHPECFKIFTRISKLRLRRVDLKGLRSWRDAFQSFEHFHNSWPSDRAARDARSEGSWNYEPGSEYLAANQLNVPGLDVAISIVSEDTKAVLRKLGRHSSDTPIDRSKSDSDNDEVSIPSRDLNQILSRNIQERLLKCSTHREFESLKKTSPELDSMDRASWRQLITEEMPWLWEVENLRFSTTDFQKLYLRVKFSLCITFKGLYNRKRIWEDMNIICDYIASQHMD